jgi:outer membrane biosynthesis protein TonB
VGEMDQEHILVITKSRAADLADKVINRPGKAFAAELLKWAKGGAPAEPKPAGEPEPKTHEPARRNDPSLRRETKPDPKPSTETPKPPPLPKTKPAVEPKTERAEPVPVAKPAEPPTDVTPTPAQVTEPPKIAKLPVAQRNAAIRDIFSRSARAGENAGQMKETIGKLIGLGRPINGSHEIPDAAIPHVISHYDKSNGSGVQS